MPTSTLMAVLFFLDQHKVPTGYLLGNVLRDELDSIARKHFRVDHKIIKDVYVNQVFLHEENIKEYEVDRQEVVDLVCEHLMKNKNVAYAFDLKNIPAYLPEPLKSMTANGYHPKRSGQIQIIPRPGVTEDFSKTADIQKDGFVSKGTNHIAWSPDDSHIPLIFMGWGVPHG